MKIKIKLKKEDISAYLWDNIKCSNICVIGVPEGKDREKGQKTYSN